MHTAYGFKFPTAALAAKYRRLCNANSDRYDRAVARNASKEELAGLCDESEASGRAFILAWSTDVPWTSPACPYGCENFADSDSKCPACL